VKAAVVGAGINGVAAAYALACGGDEVTLYEQFRIGHTNGSSHGASRIFRLAYPEPEWVRLAQEALPAWRALEADSGEELLELSGLVELAPPGVEGSRAALEACGARFEEVTEPGFDGSVIYQPDAGIVRADLAHRAFLDGALRRGAQLVEDTRVEQLDDLDADVVVVTAGAWVRRLLPELPVRPTRETVCYFDTAPRTLIELGGERGAGFYALRDPGGGIKAGLHRSGPRADPDDGGGADESIADLLCEWVVARFPGVDPEPTRVDTCFYTSTADERFILERRGRIVVGSACSGHGFKFAPVIGERLAALAHGGGPSSTAQ
jgi:sarcosine oxidase